MRTSRSIRSSAISLRSWFSSARSSTLRPSISPRSTRSRSTQLPEALLAPSVTRRLIEEFARRPVREAPPQHLSSSSRRGSATSSCSSHAGCRTSRSPSDCSSENPRSRPMWHTFSLETRGSGPHPRSRLRVRVRSRAARPTVTIHEGAQTDRGSVRPHARPRMTHAAAPWPHPTLTVCVLAMCPRTRVD